IALPSLPPLSFDLLAIRDRAAADITALIDGIAMSSLPPLSFDLTGVRAQGAASLTELADNVSIPALPPLNVSLSAVVESAQIKISDTLATAKSSVQSATLTVPPEGLQIDMQVVVDTAIKAIGLLIGGPTGFMATLIVGFANDVVTNLTGMSLLEHVNSAVDSIASAVGIDLDKVKEWIQDKVGGFFNFLSDSDTAVASGSSAGIETSLQAGLDSIADKAQSAVGAISDAIASTGIDDGATVGEALRNALADASGKISDFFTWVTTEFQAIDFATIGADVGQWLSNAITSVSDWIRDALGALFAADSDGLDVTDSIANLTSGVVDWIGTSISGMVQFISGFVSGLFGGDEELVDTKPFSVTIGEIGVSLLTGIVSIGTGVVEGALSSQVFTSVASWISDIKEQAGNLLKKLSALPGQIVSSVVSSTLFTSVSQWITRIIGSARKLLSQLASLPSTIVDGVVNGTLFTNLSEWVSGITDKARDLLTSLTALPSNIVDSVISSGLFTSFWEWTSNILENTRKLLSRLVAIPRGIVESVTTGDLFTSVSNWISGINDHVKRFLEGFVGLPGRIADRVLNSPFFWNIWTWVQGIVSSSRNLVTSVMSSIVDWIRSGIRQVIPNEITILGQTIVSDIHSSLGLERGGPASAGELYQVNEQGVEYFKPHTDGQVIPLGDPRVFGGQVGGGVVNTKRSVVVMCTT
ncbi:MAG: hypothetical protein OXE95_07950, partial [Chloroflexi bacterium]|nr:hypothetical protein [Chloroflexota bacterium]